MTYHGTQVRLGFRGAAVTAFLLFRARHLIIHVPVFFHFGDGLHLLRILARFTFDRDDVQGIRKINNLQINRPS